MTIQTIENDHSVQLLPEGRIDTLTSPQLQEAILQAFKTASMVTLDFSKVAYISSAGLRALLIGQKTAASKGGKMELIHVPAAVQTVLDSVGFSKILTIR